MAKKEKKKEQYINHSRRTILDCFDSFAIEDDADPIGTSLNYYHMSGLERSIAAALGKK